ncbi:MAG: glycerol dehydrogenase [bacterium]
MATPLMSPRTFFASHEVLPRMYLSPGRYIQGPGLLHQIGRYVALLGVRRVGILASQRGLGAQGVVVADSLAAHSITSVNAMFSGECSIAEIETHVAALADQQLDCLIGLGGGKPVDAAKCIAHRLDVPVVIVPTLASNDAPCSALSVVYTPKGVQEAVEFFPINPAMVLVDTDVVVSASERYLVAGMGDAMATWYEARIVSNNSTARTPSGARPTLAACAIGQVCAQTLYEHGESAASAVAATQNNDSVEAVVEANTLLSGLGFESGGLALAHALALGCTHIEDIHDNYLHGEMVALGLMTQLAMEQSEDASKVATFFARVGLPVHLEQISMSPQRNAALDRLIEATLANPIAHHMPMSVDGVVLRRAILDADTLGQAVAKQVGDTAYRKLHA